MERLRPVAGRDAGPHRGVRVHPLGGRRARQQLEEHLEVAPGRDELLDAHDRDQRPRAGSGTSGRCPRTRRRRPCRSRRPRSSRRRRRPARAGTSRAGGAGRPRRARGGSSVRPAGAGRPTRPISSMKMSRISRPVAVDRRHEDVRRQVVAELDDHLGEVGLPDVDALLRRSASLSSISWVAIDLTLTTSVGAGSRGDRGDDRVRLGRVARPVDGPAGGGDRAPRAARAAPAGRAGPRP